MENELSITPENLLALKTENGLGELIKPLIREIYLFDTYVAGTSFIKDASVFDKIKVDDKLVLQREDNKFDSKAILVLTEDRVKLGYVPERDNAVFSRLMDAGKCLTAKITKIDRKYDFTSIAIAIYLVDF